MTEPAQRLRVTLAQLHGELERVGELDPDVRAMLEASLADIHQVLERTGESKHAEAGEAAEKEDSSIRERLNEAVQHFEESHPSLATNLGSLIDTLQQMGI